MRAWLLKLLELIPRAGRLAERIRAGCQIACQCVRVPVLGVVSNPAFRKSGWARGCRQSPVQSTNLEYIFELLQVDRLQRAWRPALRWDGSCSEQAQAGEQHREVSTDSAQLQLQGTTPGARKVPGARKLGFMPMT